MENVPTTPVAPRSPHVMRRTGAAIMELYTAVFEVRSKMDALGLETCDALTEPDSLSQFDAPSGVTSFMTLPAELKYEIFDYLVRPGDVYVHWSARAANHDVRFTHILEEWDVDAGENNPIPHKHLSNQRFRSPTSAQTQLFLVCKQLRQEAMHYYFSHNTFHLMGNDSQLPYPS